MAIKKEVHCDPPAGRPSWDHHWNFASKEWTLIADGEMRKMEDSELEEFFPNETAVEYYKKCRASGLTPDESYGKTYQELRDTTKDQSYPHNM